MRERRTHVFFAQWCDMRFRKRLSQKLEPRAVVRDGEIVARPTGTIAVTFDHRVVDGARAAEFGLAVIRRLESAAEPEPGVPQTAPGS